MSIPGLSPSEERIVLLLATGLSANGIAAVTGIDERTVEWHLRRAGRKLERSSTRSEGGHPTGDRRDRVSVAIDAARDSELERTDRGLVCP